MSAPRYMFLLLLPLLLGAPRALCATWVIYLDGSGDAPSIQAAIDAATPGDEILVMPGTYLENINYNGKDLVIRSDQGPAVTTIDGSSEENSVVLFHNGETRAAVLEGFTITGGTGNQGIVGPSSLKGGGILCLDSSPVIRGNHIVGNQCTRIANGGGAGVSIGHGGVLFNPIPAPLIEDNLFESNVADGNGGAVSAFHVVLELRRNTFRENTSGFDGGGVFGLFGQGYAVIEDNEFWGNHAGDHGGGVYLADIGGATQAMTVDHNLFVRNIADGSDTGDTRSGGAMYGSRLSGAITTNTMTQGEGYGESSCSGGGIALFNSPADLDISLNVIAMNTGCGIACRGTNDAVLGPNLLWQNDGGDLGVGPGVCPPNWADAVTFEDPQFCGPEVDDFSVAMSSPALTGEHLMGYYDLPGCEAPVVVQLSTWGGIKLQFGRPPD